MNIPYASSRDPLKLLERKTCPICEHQDVSNIYKCLIDQEPVSGYINWRLPTYFKNPSAVVFDFELSYCPNCLGLYHKYIHPSIYASQDQYWRDSFDIIYQKQQKKTKGNISLRNVWEVHLIKNILGGFPDEKTILDFGCGWGTWCQVATSFGFNVYGSEIDDAKRQILLKNHISLLDLDDLNGRNFDFINTEQVFEHLINPLEILIKLCKHLKKGGLIRISVPNGQFVKNALNNPANWMIREKTGKKSLNPIWLFEHINCFTPETIVTMAKKAGLTHFRLPFIEYIQIQKHCMPLFAAVCRAFNHSIGFSKTSLYFVKP